MLFPKDKETGRAIKVTAGAWVLTAFALLARFKFLRDTVFDPFGWTEHRRLERRLITEYEETVDELLDGLTPESADLAVEIASLPEHVRGFEHVRARHLEQARERERELLEAFRR